MTFYRILRSSGRKWHLSICNTYSDGTDVDAWQFSRCEQVSHSCRIPFHADPLPRADYNDTAFYATVVSARFAQVVSEIADKDIQLIPADIDAEEPGEWYVLNALRCVDCIDHEQSRMTYYDKPHERAGQIRSVLTLIIDPHKAMGFHYFRPKGWCVAEIVSEELRDRLWESGLTGFKFDPVTR